MSYEILFNSDGEIIVRGPNAELVRLVSSPYPMQEHVMAHFLEGEIPERFQGFSATRPGLYVGVPWGTVDEITALLRTEWA